VQEHIVRGIGRAEIRARPVARTVEVAAVGVGPLDSGRARKLAAAAMGDHGKLKPGNVCCRRAGRIGDYLAGDGAAVARLPIGPA
jgi:hypothetical protein